VRAAELARSVGAVAERLGDAVGLLAALEARVAQAESAARLSAAALSEAGWAKEEDGRAFSLHWAQQGIAQLWRWTQLRDEAERRTLEAHCSRAADAAAQLARTFGREGVCAGARPASAAAGRTLSSCGGGDAYLRARGALLDALGAACAARGERAGGAAPAGGGDADAAAVGAAAAGGGSAPSTDERGTALRRALAGAGAGGPGDAGGDGGEALGEAVAAVLRAVEAVGRSEAAEAEAASRRLAGGGAEAWAAAAVLL
jgi:hypothetical protein